MKGEGRKKKGKAVLLVELSVGRRGCRMAGKWSSRTAVFGASRDPRDWCHCIHCQGEERERNIRDIVMYREKERGEAEERE